MNSDVIQKISNMTQPTEKRTWRIRSRLWWLTWLVPAILFVTLGSISKKIEDLAADPSDSDKSLYSKLREDNSISRNNSAGASVEDITKSAKKGDKEAQYHLGLMYVNGESIPQDYKKAFDLFTKSAEQGYIRAQNNLGWMYAEGKGTPQDDKQAVHWYTKSAEQGDAWAQHNLGWRYLNGRGVPQDNKQAVHWYTKSAEQGDAGAQHNLGWMYNNGRGVPQDDQQAVHWYTKSAEHGDAGAQHNLAWMSMEEAFRKMINKLFIGSPNLRSKTLRRRRVILV